VTDQIINSGWKRRTITIITKYARRD